LAAGGIDRRYLVMPHVEPGMVVGLFGGSFNPTLGLDQLWWMVTPGNPLKSKRALAPLAERLALSEAIFPDPKVRVTAFEQSLGSSYTAQVLAHVKRRHPSVRFIWIMGADNLVSFHRWQNWQRIAMTFPIAVIDRPGSTLSFLSSRMARTFDHARIDERDASLLARMRAPAWTFIHGPRSSLSSTQIRKQNDG
jgi:nicotinate-nucleotide adenylyltransferase